MTMPNRDPALSQALAALVPLGVRIGHRIIGPGDEDELMATELAGFAGAAEKVLRQSGAARAVARELLGAISMHDAALPRAASRAPIWPSGIVGSMAHDEEVAVAAVTSTRHHAALGIDVEPAIPLPPEVVPLVSTAQERSRYAAEIIESRLLFVIKEAVYKALNPTDGIFLEFHDVEVDLDGRSCRTRHGRQTKITFATMPRMVAVCFI